MRKLIEGFPWFPESIFVALVLAGVVILVTNIVPTRGQLARLTEEKQRLRQEVRALEREQARLDTYSEALENDPQTVERAVRKTFRITREGEKVLRFDEDGETKDESVLPKPR